jgi:hypothetical protein
MFIYIIKSSTVHIHALGIIEDIISSSLRARGMTLQLVKLSINIKMGARINICIFE